jgi:acyl carrier protein
MAPIDGADVRTALKYALEEALQRELPELRDDVRLFGDLALDSTGFIELLMSLEDSIGLEVDPDDLTPDVFETVGSLTAYLSAAQAARQEPVN